MIAPAATVRFAVGFSLGIVASVLLGYFVVAARLKAEAQQWQTRAATAEAAAVGPLVAESVTISDEEIVRLRQGFSELLRVRGEWGRLLRELREARKVMRSLASINPFTNNLTASVSAGGALVYGGWQDRSGNRVYAFVEANPQLWDAPGIVKIKARLVAVPESHQSELGLEWEGECGLMDEDTLVQYFKRVKKAEVKVANLPEIKSLSGLSVSLPAIDMQRWLSQDSGNISSFINIVPMINGDARSVEMKIHSELGAEW